MRRWFLSYTSQDVALAQALKAELQRSEPDAQIFFAPEKMRAGGFWMQQLADELAQSTAFVLLAGESGIGHWQVIEYHQAFQRRATEPNYPVILIVSARRPAPGLPFGNQVHWVITEDPTSEATIGKIIDATSEPVTPQGELWRHTKPYRGLEAMTEANSEFFIGREHETSEVIGALAGTADKVALLLGNSGVGKSSVAQAGVIAALLRQDWTQTAAATGQWPQIFRDSRRWCFLKFKPGAEPLRALVHPFLWTWQFDAVDPRRAELQSSWALKLLDGSVGLRDLLDATQAHYRDELNQPEPPAFLLYIDQGEELYVRQTAERERRRFSEILAEALPDPRLRVMMSMRADFFGELQKDEALYAVHCQINVPPLRKAQLREVVSKPPDMLSARFETAEDSVQDVGALPLLSYTLDDMWGQMIERGFLAIQRGRQGRSKSGSKMRRLRPQMPVRARGLAALHG